MDTRESELPLGRLEAFSDGVFAIAITLIVLELGWADRRRGGSRVGYRLSAQATTTFTVQRAVTGKRKGGSCVKATKKLRHARNCTRYVPVGGSFALATGSGKQSFRFSDRLRGRALRPGAYRLTAKAMDSSGPSKPVSHRFTAAG